MYHSHAKGTWHRNLRCSGEIPIIQILNRATLFKLQDVNLTALSNWQKESLIIQKVSVEISLFDFGTCRLFLAHRTMIYTIPYQRSVVRPEFQRGGGEQEGGETHRTMYFDSTDFKISKRFADTSPNGCGENFYVCKVTFLPSANEVAERQCFYTCLWFCSQGGGVHPPSRHPPGQTLLSTLP